MEEIQALLAQLKETQTELRSREQKSDARIEELTQKLEEQSKQYDDLMVRMNRPHGMLVSGKSAEEIEVEKRTKLIFEYMRTGNDTELRALGGVDAEGNVFTTPDIVKEIQRIAFDENEIRQKAWIGKTGSDRVKLTAMDKAKAGYGNIAPTDQDLAATSEYLNVEDIKAYITINNNNLADSEYDLAGTVTFDLGKAAGEAEGDAFIKGDGVEKPNGVICAKTLARAVVSPAVGKLGADDAEAIEFITSAIYSLKKGYRKGSVLMCNSKTEAKLNALRDSDGAKLLTKEGGVSYFDGMEIVTCETMDDIGPGKVPIVVGNLYYYKVYDRAQYLVRRLEGSEYTLKGVTGFLLIGRHAAGVTQAEAFVPLKIKAA